MRGHPASRSARERSAGRGFVRAGADGIGVAAFASAVYGIVTAAGIAALNPLGFGDGLLLSLYLAIGSLLGALPAGIVLAVIYDLTRLPRRFGADGRVPFLVAVYCAVGAFLYGAAWLHVEFLPAHPGVVRLGQTSVLILLLLAVAVAGAAAFVAARAIWRLRRRALPAGARITTLVAALPAALAAGLAFAALASPPPVWSPSAEPAPIARVSRPPDGGSPLLVIAADALSWNVAAPLVERGEMPHLARLLAAGRGLALQVSPSLLTPVVWTTIATGRPPQEHGIEDFTWTRFRGLSRPYSTLRVPPFVGVHEFERAAERAGLARLEPLNATHRRAPALWEVASRAGLRAAMIGYPITWPAESLAGVSLVTDKAFIPALSRRMWPDSLQAIVDEAGGRARQEGAGPFAGEPPVAASFVNDTARVRIARDILRSVTVDLLVVYVDLGDAAGHLYWGFHRPGELFAPPPEEERARRGDLLEESYRRIDGWIGELCEAAGESVSVVVLSDHGMKAQPRMKWLGYRRLRDGGHRTGPAGLWIVSGPAFANGAPMEGAASALDVLPTLLAAMGVPVARDLPGTVRGELLARGAPRATVASFGSRPSPLDAPGSAEADRELRERLRSLGYIN